MTPTEKAREEAKCVLDSHKGDELKAISSVMGQKEDICGQYRGLQEMLHEQFRLLGIDPESLPSWPAGFAKLSATLTAKDAEIERLKEQIDRYESNAKYASDLITTYTSERDEAREQLAKARELLYLSTAYVAECSEISISGASQSGASMLLPQILAFLSDGKEKE